jgi:hypothetical protein
MRVNAGSVKAQISWSEEARMLIFGYKNIAAGLLMGSLAVGFYYAAKVATVSRIAAAQGIATPFVLEREVYSFQEDESGRLMNKETIARRSDGTTVEVRNGGLPEWGMFVRKITHLDGRSITLCDQIKGKSTWPIPPTEVVATLKKQILDPPDNCVFPGHTLVKEEDVILNHKVAVIAIDSLGTVRVTDWRAPDLGCTSLQYRVEERLPDGSWKVVAEARPVILEIGEPRADLFEPGEGYNEVKPSELERQALAQLGITEIPEIVRKSWGAIDQGYLGVGN